MAAILEGHPQLRSGFEKTLTMFQNLRPDEVAIGSVQADDKTLLFLYKTAELAKNFLYVANYRSPILKEHTIYKEGTSWVRISLGKDVEAIFGILKRLFMLDPSTHEKIEALQKRIAVPPALSSGPLKACV